MERKGPTSIDHSRANWKPAMDHFLIELMLDEVQRGNRIGRAFKNKSWARMIELFNKKFECRYTKNALGHRYKNLKKQYNAIQMLLNQSGFGWDRRERMVVADDYVWDDYIKTHPDVQQYRTKTVPYYEDLCVIYGTADGGYNHSGHNVDLDEGKRKDSQAPTNSDRPRTNWTPPMDRYLIDILLDQVHRGNKIGQAFSKQAWKHIIGSFNTQFGVRFDKEILRNRYKTFKKQCHDIKIILNQSGFDWDITRQMLTADDNIWDDYLELHPDARQYRTKFVPYYKDLCVICGDATVDGQNIHSTQDVNLDNDVPRMIAGVLGGPQSPAMSIAHDSEQNSRSATLPISHRKRKVQSSDGGVAGALREMADAVALLANKKIENESSVSIDNVIDVLQAVPGIEEDLIIDACDYLEDERKARTFLALDVTLRKKWLTRKLRP
ncbi:hypothetical protein HHK36_019432 [Tetracentron sinense]|uniref:Myb/SANT-like domain-containing protein n=1 Tax=Tetracentron sinense TaxID=13715 RepID=A0A834YZ70_TETSI|nr:hypothetical protein HHK36_019432 [Tetracentron sinense]